MHKCQQTSGVSVYKHGEMVYERYEVLADALDEIVYDNKQDALTQLDSTAWRLPAWLHENAHFIRNTLDNMGGMVPHIYLLYHDIGNLLFLRHIYVMEKQHTRPCPICGQELSYKLKGGLTQATKKNSLCSSCNTKQQYANNPTKNTGASNGRTGKKLYDVMVAKHGQELADVKYEQYKAKLSVALSGENNPSYGIPGHKQGGAMSYAGWYKELYFRSSFELAFILEYEETYGHLPVSAEKGFRINLDAGHTYTPDFYCTHTSTLYEIKSKKFQNTEINQIKYEAAKKYCYERNLKFEVMNEDGLSKYKQGRALIGWLEKLLSSGIIKMNNAGTIKLAKAVEKRNQLLETFYIFASTKNNQ